MGDIAIEKVERGSELAEELLCYGGGTDRLYVKELEDRP